MPWKDHDVTEERWRFIEDWRSEDWNMAELCDFYGVTRKTGYKWVQRYELGGLEAPHHHPNEVSVETEKLVIGMRAVHPSWGAPKIRARLMRDHAGKVMPAESTMGEILKRNGLTLPQMFRFSVKWRGSVPPLASVPPLRVGDFQGIRVYRSDVFWEERERRTPALNIVSMSPPSYPSAWLHPCRARFRFTW